MAQLFESSDVEFAPFTLRVGAERAAAIRPFLPFQTKPVQIFEHGRNKFRFATGTIQVLVAQDKGAAAGDCTLLGGPECPGMTEMKKTCGGGRETAAVNLRLCDPRVHVQIKML